MVGWRGGAGDCSMLPTRHPRPLASTDRLHMQPFLDREAGVDLVGGGGVPPQPPLPPTVSTITIAPPAGPVCANHIWSTHHNYTKALPLWGGPVTMPDF